MDERPADVEREIRVTRERMADTIAEIEDRVSEKTAAVKQKLDPLRLAADHPWPAVAVAFAAGLLLSVTGSDRKAMRSAAEAAKRAGTAAADAARDAGPMLGDAVDRVKGRFGGDSDAPASTASDQPGTMRRVLDRASSALGVDEMRIELQRGAMLE